MQIGAFDGVEGDDLRDLIITHRLRGVLIEPQPLAFARLQQAYCDQPQVTLLNAAISEEEGVREIYCERGKASAVASFYRQHLRRHGIADDAIVSLPVACHTVQSALRAAGLERVDFIQIDAEGHDWPIIRSIDFNRLQARILRFEYRHMSSREANACVKLLSDHGFRFLVEAWDIIAHR